MQIIWQTTSCLSESRWFCFTNFNTLLKGERLCIGSYWYWKLSKSLEICHVLDGEIFLSMWCCRSLTDGTPSFEILYEGFRLCLCAASFVSILWTFLLDLELSETLDFSFAATQAVAGGAAEDLHDVNCNFQCLRHRDWRGEKLRGANQGFCDTSEGFLWTAGSEISSQLTAKMIQTTKMLHNGTLQTAVGQPQLEDVGSSTEQGGHWGSAWCSASFIPGWGPTVATWHSYTICLPVAFPSLCFAPSPNP